MNCFLDLFKRVFSTSAPAKQEVPLENVAPVKLNKTYLSSEVKGTLAWYRLAYDLCEIDPGQEQSVAASMLLVLAGKERYQRVEALTGVPWYVLGAIHFKEATCDWKACLHNGERIIGTGKLTTIVPKGRGPFTTWEEAAVDALRGEALGKMKSWEIGALLMACEKYNGWGYQTGAGKGENSPYLWARSTINDGYGKYVADGKFDPNAPTNKTTGLALIIKRLEICGHIKVERIS